MCVIYTAASAQQISAVLVINPRLKEIGERFAKRHCGFCIHWYKVPEAFPLGQKEDRKFGGSSFPIYSSIQLSLSKKLIN